MLDLVFVLGLFGCVVAMIFIVLFASVTFTEKYRSDQENPETRLPVLVPTLIGGVLALVLLIAAFVNPVSIVYTVGWITLFVAMVFVIRGIAGLIQFAIVVVQDNPNWLSYLNK